MSRNPPIIHFTEDELAERRRRTIEALTAQGLEGLLCFRQESMYYLSGYDTFGYVFFQCLYLGADGTMTLLTRAPDVRVAAYTSVVEDIRMWVDAPDANPAEDLKAILDGHGCRGRKLGVEYEAYGLTGRNAKRVDAALEGFCELEDASDVVNRLRVVKSPAELEYVHRAAALADRALVVAKEMARPGVFDGDVLAEMQAVVFRGDGDYPGNEFIVNSGRASMFGRYIAGHRVMTDDDYLTVEFAGVYRHYHACLMSTLKVGRPNARHAELHAIGLEALAACQAALVPGRIVGDVFASYAETLTRRGITGFANACGYCLGTTFSPNWMDWPMFYRDNPVVVEPGMVFFMHMTTRDHDRGIGAAPGETVVVTDSGCKRLSREVLEAGPF
ncbi:MAG: Xaa-Pro peptidase family protein [Thiotrichales bacterium]|nr:Xaa-Pro peptidase family protein [Thiotrichales bacterium]